ncbi:hypothetical protein GQR58_030170 [Nymphon striatum]|nr:hypothetical protein GQR58_030170 [Nymphon striatum]
MNERPLGVMPSTDSEINILTPNCFIIGRSASNNPVGLEYSGSKLTVRITFLQELLKLFWIKWSELFAPMLMRQSKWRKSSRNLKPGDVVLISDSNSLRGQYKLGLVKEVYPGIDGFVRKVKVSYKNYKVGEKVTRYAGAPDSLVIRSVQKLALLMPVDEDESI